MEIILHEGNTVPKGEKWLDDYGYSEKELEHIGRIYEAEKPRGANILYWEDVQVGDMPQQLTTGPAPFTGMGGPPPGGNGGGVPKRTFPRYVEQVGGGPVMGAYVPDRETGLLYPNQGGRHSSDRAARFEGAARAWLFNFVSRELMCRQATNWMGDDAFMCKYGWCLNLRGTITDMATATIKLISRENGFPHYQKVINR